MALGGGGQRPAVDGDGVVRRVGLCAGLGHDAPVDSHAPRGQQCLGPAPRGHAGVCQYFV